MEGLNNNKVAPPLPSEVKDFAFFREKGIQLLQKLSGNQWTDHNLHDPGITILEQLCFALSDLSYRIGFPISDIMAEADLEEWPENFRPAYMLSSGPVHLQDWRKLLIDIEGVRNAWVFPIDATSDDYDARVFYDPVEEALRMSLPSINRDSKRSIEPLDLLGLYRVIFIPDPGQSLENLRKNIRSRLHEYRNLCEDFHQIQALSSKSLFVEGEIEIEDVSDPAALLARIYFEIQEYLSPRIQFHTLQDRLETGRNLEDILDGPLLDHGFLDDKELAAFQVRRSVRISDVIRLIMNLDGVRAVKSLRISMSGGGKAASTQKGEPWELLIPDNFAPILLIPSFPRKNKPSRVGIKFQKKGLPVLIDWAISWKWLRKFDQEEAERKKPLRQNMAKEARVSGRRREIVDHQSIQRQFPDFYGIGETGLPKPVSTRRIAQTRQFKAYLAIFDQLLANAFAQLGGVGQMFSLTRDPSKGNAFSKKTYFSQSMRGEIPDFEPMIRWRAIKKVSPAGTPPVYLRRGDNSEDKAAAYQAQLQEDVEGGMRAPARQKLWDRRNRLLNHLLARFGEQINELDGDLKKGLFSLKEEMIAEYASLGLQRGRAFNYTRSTWGEKNVSGLERRLGMLLGFDQSTRRSLADLDPSDPGGFHMVEHILLRPGVEDKNQKNPIIEIPISDEESRPPLKDPFSLQLSFFFPAWLSRFDEIKNPGFRQSVVKTLREETPAHLRIFVHWLNRDNTKNENEMKDFEESFQNWIDNLKAR